MSRPVLIDTSAWIEAMRARGDEALRSRVQIALRQGRARFCDLVRVELWNSVGAEPERRWLAKLEQTVDTVPTDARVWNEARSLAAGTRRQGLTVPSTDLLIAACARIHGLDLLHRDAHFDRLEELL